MKVEIASALREITVNVKLSGEDVPVISTSRGYKFTPDSLHALWVREDSGRWELVCTELKGTFPKSGRAARRTYWCLPHELPEWIGNAVAKATPAEVDGVAS